MQSNEVVMGENIYEALKYIAPLVRYLNFPLEGGQKLRIAYGVIAKPDPKIRQIHLIPFAFPGETKPYLLSLETDIIAAAEFSETNVDDLRDYLPRELAKKDKFWASKSDYSSTEVSLPTGVTDKAPDYRELLVKNTNPPVEQKIIETANKVGDRLEDLLSILSKSK